MDEVFPQTQQRRVSKNRIHIPCKLTNAGTALSKNKAWNRILTERKYKIWLGMQVISVFGSANIPFRSRAVEA
jgi:hypothetical protein